jgi:hypothetical protein
VDLLVLAKEPRPGRVKTRLCPPCSPPEAARIAEAALADTLAAAVACGADRVVLALDGEPGPWCPAGVHITAQGDGDLAARLATTWRATSGPALQVGMDTPQLDATILDAAMAQLVDDGSSDAVLGLAADGGWWAIGFTGPAPDGVFDGIPTSRSDTGHRQLQRLRSLGLATAALPVLRDVDTWADAQEVAADRPGSRFAAAVDAVAATTR